MVKLISHLLIFSHFYLWCSFDTTYIYNIKNEKQYLREFSTNSLFVFLNSKTCRKCIKDLNIILKELKGEFNICYVIKSSSDILNKRIAVKNYNVLQGDVEFYFDIEKRKVNDFGFSQFGIEITPAIIYKSEEGYKMLKYDKLFKNYTLESLKSIINNLKKTN